jgi:hypothetical protein
MAQTSGRNGAGIGYDDVGQGEPALLFIPGWCNSSPRAPPGTVRW